MSIVYALPYTIEPQVSISIISSFPSPSESRLPHTNPKQKLRKYLRLMETGCGKRRNIQFRTSSHRPIVTTDCVWYRIQLYIDVYNAGNCETERERVQDRWVLITLSW